MTRNMARFVAATVVAIGLLVGAYFELAALAAPAAPVPTAVRGAVEPVNVGTPTPVDRYRAALVRHYGPDINVDKLTTAGIHLCDVISQMDTASRQIVTDQVRAEAGNQAGYAIDAAAGTLCPAR